MSKPPGGRLLRKARLRKKRARWLWAKTDAVRAFTRPERYPFELIWPEEALARIDPVRLPEIQEQLSQRLLETMEKRMLRELTGNLFADSFSRWPRLAPLPMESLQWDTSEARGIIARYFREPAPMVMVPSHFLVNLSV